MCNYITIFAINAAYRLATGCITLKTDFPTLGKVKRKVTCIRAVSKAIKWVFARSHLFLNDIFVICHYN